MTTKRKAKNKVESNGVSSKKRHKRRVDARSAGVLANVLVYHAKDFRGQHVGDGEYVFKVPQEDKDFLDQLIESLEGK
jgi:hypothetical protein